MWRIVRISLALVVASVGAAAVHAGLGLGPEFLGPGLGGVIDLGLILAVGLLVSLCDRELFWATPSRRGRHRH